MTPPESHLPELYYLEDGIHMYVVSSDAMDARNHIAYCYRIMRAISVLSGSGTPVHNTKWCIKGHRRKPWWKFGWVEKAELQDML